MNIKRAFLAAVAVLMLPGAALAQSTVTFDVGANFFGADESVTAYLVCNSGVPLEQEFVVGGPDRVNFAVTAFTPGSCTVSFSEAPDGFDQTGVNVNGAAAVPFMDCVFDDTGAADNEAVVAATNMCTAVFQPGDVEFTADVDWMFSDDADVSLADNAMLEMYCEGGASTTVDASGDSTELPGVLSVTPEDTCYATLTGTGSAIVVDDSACQDVEVTYGTDEACIISAGVFFEGIPTLSQYGMAIMALLMLAVGFVGFRRFV